MSSVDSFDSDSPSEGWDAWDIVSDDDVALVVSDRIDTVSFHALCCSARGFEYIRPTTKITNLLQHKLLLLGISSFVAAKWYYPSFGSADLSTEAIWKRYYLSRELISRRREADLATKTAAESRFDLDQNYYAGNGVGVFMTTALPQMEQYDDYQWLNGCDRMLWFQDLNPRSDSTTTLLSSEDADSHSSEVGWV